MGGDGTSIRTFEFMSALKHANKREYLYCINAGCKYIITLM